MKKALLVTIDFPPKIGGVANYYENLCQNLPANKIAVLTEKQKDSKSFDKKQNYKIYREDLFYNYLWPQWLKMIFKMRKIIKKEKIEVIYVGQILPVGEAAFFLSLPFIIFTHGMDITLPQKNKKKKYLLKKIIAKSYKLVANSNFTREELMKLGAKAQKVTIINPSPDRKLLEVLDKQLISQLRQKYNLNNKRILLSVGRLVKRKGFDEVIQSLPQVLKSIPDLVYVVVGDGPERQNLENIISEINLNKQVLLIGAASQKELSAWYYLCQVFIMTPKQLPDGDVEGFGTVFLEANMFGKPVIATASGGISDAVSNGLNGLLINNNDIVKTLLMLLNNHNLIQQLGRQGRELVNQKFNWGNQISLLPK